MSLSNFNLSVCRPNITVKNMSTLECDEIAAMVRPVNLLKKEDKLMKSKWFDYRHLHPTKATFLYACILRDELRKLNTKIRDVDGGMFQDVYEVIPSKSDEPSFLNFKKEAAKRRKQIKAINIKDNGYERLDYPLRRAFQQKVMKEHDRFCNPLLTKDRDALWKGRQTADEIGIPYDTYISCVINSMMGDYRFLQINEHTFVPRPKNMYSKIVKEWMTAEWAEMLQTRRIPEPQIEHLKGLECESKIKREIQIWLCEQIAKRPYKSYILYNFVFCKNLIAEDYAIECFGIEEIQRAKREYSSIINK